MTTTKRVTIGGNAIGSIRYFIVRGGWMFVSLFPGGAGRSRKADTFENTVSKVRVRFPDAEIEGED